MSTSSMTDGISNNEKVNCSRNKICGHNITKKQKGVVGLICSCMFLAGMIVLLVMEINKSYKCPDLRNWITCEVREDIIPTSAGYSYTVGCDNTTGGGNVPGFYFDRESLTTFSIGSTQYDYSVKFSKNSALAYFWPTWHFTLNETRGKMGYNLFGIINKYSIKWPENVSSINWYTSQITPKSIPEAIKVYSQSASELIIDNPNELFYFNTKISIAKAYQVCIRTSTNQNPEKTLLAMGVVVSYAIHN